MSDSDKQERVSPFFETNVPDERLSLLQVPAEIVHCGDESIRARGKIEVFQLWSPMRFRFRFEGTVQPANHSEQPLPISECWDHFNEEVNVQVKSSILPAFVDYVRDDVVEGEIEADEFVVGTDHKVDRVTFHIPNYPNPSGGRIVSDREEGDFGAIYDWAEIVLEAQGWRVRMQPVRKVRDLDWAANEAYGTVLSGVGEIRKMELQQFSPKKVKDILEPLHHFLSFAFLEWTPPLLVVGSNTVAERSWQYYRNHSLRRIRHGRLKGFLPIGGRDRLSTAFQGFVSKWFNPSWQEPIRTAVKWLVESSFHADRDENGAIAMAQIPLEMLAHMVFVDEQEIVISEEFERLSAASKMQLLLTHCQIDLSVPAELPTLKKINQDAPPTGPQLLSKVRNTIIHPSQKNRRLLDGWHSKYGAEPDVVRQETHRLFEHYITLVLLFLIGYEGEFNNRLKLFGFAETVPWANQSDSCE